MSLIPLGFWGEQQGLVTNGLVLHVDAVNTASYSGSGATTWNDLSGNGNHVSMYHGASAKLQTPTGSLPQYDAADGGTVAFSRDNNSFGQVTLPTISSSSPNAITVEFWGKLDTATFGAWFVFCFSSPAFYSFYNLNAGLGSNTGNGDARGIDGAVRNNFGYNNKVNHYAVVMHQNQSYTFNEIYINGVKTASQYQFLGTENAANRNFGTGIFNINGAISSGFGHFNVGALRIYNRVLTDSEVVNNFNFQCARFGRNAINTLIPATGLRVFYDFSSETNWYGASGSQVQDYSPLMNSGSLFGGIAWDAAGGGNKQFRSANSRFIDLNCNAGTFGLYYGSASFVFVFRYLTDGSLQYIFHPTNARAEQSDVNIRTESNLVHYSHNSVSPPSAAVAVNTWKHIVMTYNYDDLVTKIYVNGVLQTTGSQERMIGIDDGYYLGRDTSQYYDFDLGLFMAYNRVLTQAEATTLYDQQKTRFGI